MADDDNFDIDIYGDEAPDFQPEPEPVETKPDTDNLSSAMDSANEPETEPPIDSDTKLEADPDKLKENQASVEQEQIEQEQNQAQQIANTSSNTGGNINVPKQAPTEQGVKRKGEGEADERELDPGATSALKLGELQWWTTEDDIRGWANQAGVEDELKELTFNEHKTNAKSKGYVGRLAVFRHPSKQSTDLAYREVFLEMATPQAATALRRHISTFGSEQAYAKKYTIIFTRPDYNPFKSTPKDNPQRNKMNNQPAFSGNQTGFNNTSTGYRGGRGGYNRGGMNNMNGMNNMGRGGMGMNGGNGYNNSMLAGGYNAGMGGGYNNSMGGYNRGGMNMGGMRGGFQPRGGRGGFNNPMAMGGMPNMAMGGMPNMMGAMGGMGGMPNMMGMGAMGNMGEFSCRLQVIGLLRRLIVLCRWRICQPRLLQRGWRRITRRWQSGNAGR